MGAGAKKPAFSRKTGSSEATGPLAKSLWHAGGCPLRPQSAMESHWGLAESFRVHKSISTSQFVAVAAPPPRNTALRYTSSLGKGPRVPRAEKGGRVVRNTSCLCQGASQALERSSGLINTGALARCIQRACRPVLVAPISMPLLTELGWHSGAGFIYKYGAPNGAFPRPNSTESSAEPPAEAPVCYGESLGIGRILPCPQTCISTSQFVAVAVRPRNTALRYTSSLRKGPRVPPG